MRRRLRYLRTARELSYRDLGGLMFDLHRFGGRRDELLAAKLERLGQLDSELRNIEKALHDRQPVAVLRQAGVRACPRCAAIHSSEDRFCPHCGLEVSRHAEPPPASAGAGTKDPSAVPALAAPAATEPTPAPSPTTRPSDPATKTPPSPSGAPVSAQVPGSPSSPLPVGASTAPGGQPAGLSAAQPGTSADGEPAEGAEQPTRIIRRPERPEGSTAE